MGTGRYIKGRLLRGIFATVLACGLVVPAVGLNAVAEEGPDAVAAVATTMVAEDTIPSSGEGLALTGDATATMAADGSTPAADAEPQLLSDMEVPVEATAVLADAAGAPVAQAEVTLRNLIVSGGQENVDFRLDGSVIHIMTSTPLTVRNVNPATPVDTTIDIDAGVQADLCLAGVNISTGARSPINLITNSDEDGDGTKVRNAADIQHKTKLLLTLADGTTNTLVNTVTGANGWPGIRCGWGSVLVIDDSVRNLDSAGAIVTPVDGMVGADVTLVGGLSLKAGDPITLMDAANPGTLTVQGGGHSAGIGSAGKENAGTMIFNGGHVIARTLPFNSNYAYANGSGIGGGSAGSGTITIFNGGHVEAFGGSCGTGIGAGFGYHDMTGHHGCTAKPDAIVVPASAAENVYSYGYTFFDRAVAGSAFDGGRLQSGGNNAYFTVAGDITINGGLVEATAAYHGNAIGQCCAHGPASNLNHVIKVTGGTVITSVGNKISDNPTMYALGAAQGYTIVTGGSALVQNRTDNKYSPMFQGIGGTAFNTRGVSSWDDVTALGGSLPDTDKVQMLTIDLSSEFGAGEETTVPVVAWKLEVDNQVQDYGAPSYLHEGKLYLWLPENVTGKNVTVTLSYRDEAGAVHNIEPMYVEEVGGAEGSLLKRYIDIDTEKLTPEQAGYFSGLSKEYDGLPFQMLTVSAESPIDTSPFEENGKRLDDPTKIEVSYQQYAAKGDELPLPDAPVIKDGNQMPSDSGVFKFQFVSKQYSSTPPFSNNYWGHRITGWCEVTPVPAVLTLAQDGIQWGHLADDGTWTAITSSTDTAQAGNRIRLAFDVRGNNDTAATCEAPTGVVRVMIDGVAVGDPIELTEEYVEASAHSSYDLTTTTLPTSTGDIRGHETVSVVYYLDPTKADGAFAALENPVTDGEAGAHKVTLEYVADKNYIQGTDNNPANADSGATIIVPVDPEDEVEIEGPSDLTVPEGWQLIPDPVPDGKPYDPVNDPIVTDPDDPAWDDTATKVRFKEVSGTYSSFHSGAAEDFFSMELVSSSAMPVSYVSSNPAVADIVRDAEGNPVLDEDGKVKVEVKSCGEAIIVMEQQANTLYNGTKNVLRVTIAPDETIQPQVQVRVLARNVTAGKAATDPVCPGDEVEYILTGVNTTAGSVWKGANLSDSIDSRLAIDPSSVRMTCNYTGPQPAEGVSETDHYAQLSPAFYQGFDWMSPNLGWSALRAGSAQATGEVALTTTDIAKMVDSIYGGQSCSISFRATVPMGLVSRPVEGEDGPADLTDDPDGSGQWGTVISQPGAPEERADIDEDHITIVDRRVAADDGTGDPEKPGDPTDPAGTVPGLSIPIVPRDPKLTVDDDDPAGTEPDIKVEKTVTNITNRGVKTAAPGDTLEYRITVSNAGSDTAWYVPVVVDTLPRGVTYVAGSMRLQNPTDDEAMELGERGDASYSATTHTVAIHVDTLYGGESTVLSFRCRVRENASSSNIRNTAFAFGELPSEYLVDDDPGSDDPADPTDPSDPTDPAATPTPGDPYVPTERPVRPGEEGYPENPGDFTPVDPEDPEKGVYVPIGADPDDPDFDPWQGWDWTDPDLPIPSPSDPSNEAKPSQITRPDAREEELCISVAAENLDRRLEATMVGDTLAYTVRFENHGQKGQLTESVLRFQLPQGVTVVPGSIMVTTGGAADAHDGLPAGTEGEPRTIPAEAISFDEATGIIAVHAAELDPGRQVLLSFRVTVGEEARAQTLSSTGFGVGTLPSRFSGDVTDAGVAFQPAEGQLAYIGENHRINLWQTHELTVSDVVDPGEGAIAIEKTARLASDDGVVNVGDVIDYAIRLTNTDEGSVLRHAAITDRLPVGLALDVASLTLTAPDGSSRPVSASAWDAASRTLSVAVGDLAGGECWILSLSCTVETSAAGHDIGNVAQASGLRPSDVDGTEVGDALVAEEPGSAHRPETIPSAVDAVEATVASPVWPVADQRVYDQGQGPQSAIGGGAEGSDGGDGGAGAASRLPWTGSDGAELDGEAREAADGLAARFVPVGLLPATGDVVQVVPALAAGVAAMAATCSVLILRRRGQ